MIDTDGYQCTLFLPEVRLNKTLGAAQTCAGHSSEVRERAC